MNHLRYYCIQFNHSSYAPLLTDGVGLLLIFLYTFWVMVLVNQNKFHQSDSLCIDLFNGIDVL
jgi:hypothetical protein